MEFSELYATTAEEAFEKYVRPLLVDPDSWRVTATALDTHAVFGQRRGQPVMWTLELEREPDMLFLGDLEHLPPNWRAMFEKYAEIVARSEGIYFLDASEWTEREWLAIRALVPNVAD